MKQVSIYLECDCTAFRKHKRICGYVLEYIKKNGDAETREEFRAAEGTYPVRSAWTHPGTLYHLYLQPGRFCLQHAHKETAGVGRQRFYFKWKADCQSGRMAYCLGKDKDTQGQHLYRETLLYRLDAGRNGGTL